MRVKITPSKVSGTLQIPSSKSLGHRAILCAALSKGTSTIKNIQMSKDIEATLSCIKELGASYEKKEDTLIITGIHKETKESYHLDCNESGSTLRFLIPIASLKNRPITFTGKGRLLERPMSIYQKIFSDQHKTFIQQDQKIKIDQAIDAQDFVIDGNVSSQFISGLLFVLPLLDKPSTLTIKEPYESKSYVDLTISMLKKFGITIQEEKNKYIIQPNQEYKACTCTIEADYSQVAFFSVLACLNSTITAFPFDPDSLQGDKAILDIVENYTFNGNQIQFDPKCAIAKTIDLANCPDLGPILCVWASFAKGCTHIINAGRLRIKESDRIQAMEDELKKWNVDITSTQDSITIQGKESYSNDSIVEIDGHNDHRIVMAMSVFGLCANSPSIIHDAQAITKSYPTFFEDIKRLGAKVDML